MTNEDVRDVTTIEVPDNELIKRDPLLTARARDTFLRQAIPLAISSTNHKDWSFFADGLWLEASGAEKIARRFGITFGRTTIVKDYHEDAKGKFYSYVCEGEVVMSDIDRIWAVGTANSRDDFLTRKGKIEVDPDDIRKKSMSNWEVNGVTRLLGLRSITEDDLVAAGINAELISKAEFKDTKSKSSGAQPKAVVEMRAEIMRILRDNATEDGEVDEKNVASQLEVLSFISAEKTKKGEAVKGVRDIMDLSGKRLEYVYKRVKAGE